MWSMCVSSLRRHLENSQHQQSRCFALGFGISRVHEGLHSHAQWVFFPLLLAETTLVNLSVLRSNSFDARNAVVCVSVREKRVQDASTLLHW